MARMRAGETRGALNWATAAPLTLYLTAGFSGLTAITGTFFVKDSLDISAQFIASLGFWATLPWSLKILLGQLVDRLWRFKLWLVALGLALVSLSSAIMFGLLAARAAMAQWLPVQTWYVLSALAAPLGYVLQDVIADAMTVAAVPSVDGHGHPLDPQQAKRRHTTMQALARGTLILGGVLVGVVNLVMFSSVAPHDEAGRVEVYKGLYLIALTVPLLSFAGLLTVLALHARSTAGLTCAPARQVAFDARICLGGLALVGVAVALGASGIAYADWLVFGCSLAIVSLVMRKLLARLPMGERRTLLATAFLLFVFRAVPDPGPGPTWWIIDRLGADERFFAALALGGGLLALAGLFLFRHLMAERSVAFTVVWLTLLWTVLSLPAAGMYCCDLQIWTAARTHGLIDGRAIVVADTATMSLLSEIAMVPMLAWVARTAPDQLKATYFAVMISFTNLGLSLSRLGSELLNERYVITREVAPIAGNAVAVPADYSQLGTLYLVTLALALVFPLLAVWWVRACGYRLA